MLYFSELDGKTVRTEDEIVVGTLQDFIFLVSSDNPIVTKMVVKNPMGQRMIISIDYLKKINNFLTIEKEFLSSYLEENELYLEKNLLDKQIIDLKGNKIVRVNDVALNQDKEKLSIAGVDVGVLGVIRRIRFLGGDNVYRILRLFNIKVTSEFLSWADIQPLELIRGQVRLRKKEEKLEKVRPEDLADYLEKTNVINARKFLKILDTEKAADVISNLNINYQTSIFKHFRPEKAAKFLTFIDPDEAVDVLLTLSKNRQEEIISYLDENTRSSIRRLLELSKNPIGGLITTEYLSVESDYSVRQTIDIIRKKTVDFSSLDYVYIVNKDEELVGVVSLHEILLQDLDMPMYKFMTQNVIVVHFTTPEEIVIKKMLKYKLYALPVIDENKHMEGLITLDDLSGIILRKLR
ncbi:CBS domain-containing protein [Patescibacteria group bacterium]|nr:CBS domain-containing protein [Patescibacteria group bacterium]